MVIKTSRRSVVSLGSLALGGMVSSAGAANAHQHLETDARLEAVVRKYFTSWATPDWAPFDALLADDFTFTSPNGDDHISKSTFKTRCWDTQIAFISKFDIELMASRSDAVFVRYLCHTKNLKSFRNVELHKVKNNQIESIDCYFGGASTFASAVASNDGQKGCVA